MAMSDEILKELQDTGLYGFAATQGFLSPGYACSSNPAQDGSYLQGKDPASRSNPLPPPLPHPQGGHALQYHSQAGPSSEQGPEVKVEGQPQPAAKELQVCAQTNQAVDGAVLDAQRALTTSRLKLHQLVTSYENRPARSAAVEPGSKRRKTGRSGTADRSEGGRAGGKGLRHFSMKVCEKVESKGRTTYNQVADELVAEMSKLEAMEGQYDEKNIRRRVYDAINVLMAMDIIQKEKKEILWKGFPTTSSASLDRLKAERLNKVKEIEQKQQALQELVEQQQALKYVIERNSMRDLSQSSCTQLHLPFMLIQAKQDAMVEVKISEEMQDVQFDFHQSPFQILDDSQVLRSLLAYHTALAHQEAANGWLLMNSLQAAGARDGLQAQQLQQRQHSVTVQQQQQQQSQMLQSTPSEQLHSRQQRPPPQPAPSSAATTTSQGSQQQEHSLSQQQQQRQPQEQPRQQGQPQPSSQQQRRQQQQQQQQPQQQQHSQAAGVGRRVSTGGEKHGAMPPNGHTLGSYMHQQQHHAQGHQPSSAHSASDAALLAALAAARPGLSGFGGGPTGAGMGGAFSNPFGPAAQFFQSPKLMQDALVGQQH